MGKPRGILMSDVMAQACAEGRKTQTRRVIRNVTTGLLDGQGPPCPYGVPGNLLAVREAWAPHADDERENIARPKVFYRANGGDPHVNRWRPSIHMPRWATRTWLRLTALRIERVQEITLADCLAEGMDPTEREKALATFTGNTFARDWYRALWDALNADRGAGWEENPWVWVLTFVKVDAPR